MFYSTCMQAWGAVNYHNAVVISREPGSPSGHNEEESKVKRHIDRSHALPSFPSLAVRK